MNRLAVQQTDYSREDQAIWLTVCPSLPHLLTWSIYTDRHDADLMLGAQVQPLCVVHWRHGLDHLILLRGPPTGQRLEWLD